MVDRFDIFLTCECGHEATVQTEESPNLTGQRFRCSVCGRNDPKMIIWPIWQRAFRRDGWKPG